MRNLSNKHYSYSGLQSSHPQFPSVTGCVNNPREITFRVGMLSDHAGSPHWRRTCCARCIGRAFHGTIPMPPHVADAAGSR